jgi:hypothetical protein
MLRVNHTVLALVLMVAGLPLQARAACLAGVTIGQGSGETFQYMSSVIGSMGYAKEGMDRFNKTADKANAPSDQLYRIKVAGESYACAQSLIEKFKGSNDERIRTTAEVLVTAYELLAVTNRHRSEMIVSVMNASQPPLQGTVAEMAATLRAEDDAAWRDLMQALTLTSQTLPIYNADGTNSKRLRVTNTERQQFQKELERTFGKSVRGGMREGQNYLTAAAAGLHQFFGNTAFRSMDDR